MCKSERVLTASFLNQVNEDFKYCLRVISVECLTMFKTTTLSMVQFKVVDALK